MPEQTNNSGGQRRRRQQPVDNTYAHVQPQATEIERAVLGALSLATRKCIVPSWNFRCTSCL